MERLTERYVPNNEKKGIIGIKVFESENKIPLVKILSGEYLYPAIEKLAAYEDLEERLHKIFGEESTFSIADVIDALEMKLSEPDKKHPVNARILTYEEANKWQEYKDLEEQGLLVRLLCKVGDTAFRINKGAKNPIIELTVTQIDITRRSYNLEVIDRDCGELMYFKKDIGNSIFLTREEAEKKLEEMKKNEQ
jgi:hypothetical protein